MEYFFEASIRYADFNGRARRREYWHFTLYYLVFYLVCMGLDAITSLGGFTTIYALAMFVPSISVLVRRLHDTSHSAWWVLIVFVPVIGAFILLYFLVQNSHEDNQYGYNPKGINF